MKNEGLEQNQKVLEQSNLSIIDLTLWKQAKNCIELKNLFYPTKDSVHETYNTFIEFERQKADRILKGIDESRKSEIHHYKANP